MLGSILGSPYFGKLLDSEYYEPSATQASTLNTLNVFL